MKKNVLSFLAITMTAGIALAGCGSNSSAKYDVPMMAENGFYASEPAMEYSDDVYEYEESMEEAKIASDSDTISDSDVASASNRKLIKTVNLSVETREFDTLVSNIDNKIIQLGGYTQSADVRGNSYNSTSNRSAYIVARIPAKNLDQFVSSIEGQTNITSKNESAEDVTLQYSDVKAHIDSLRVEQERLNDLLAEAESLETIITLQSRLTEVRYELESYESRLRLMDNQVDYSTVNLSISEVKEYKPEPVEELTFGQRLSREFVDSCKDAFETIQDFIIGFVAFLPVLFVLLIIFGVVGGCIAIVILVVIKIINKCKSKSNTKSKKKFEVKSLVNKKKADKSAEEAVASDDKDNSTSGDMENK